MGIKTLNPRSRMAGLTISPSVVSAAATAAGNGSSRRHPPVNLYAKKPGIIITKSGRSPLSKASSRSTVSTASPLLRHVAVAVRQQPTSSGTSLTLLVFAPATCLHLSPVTGIPKRLFEPIVFSACLFKGSKSIRKSRNIDDDMVIGAPGCGAPSGSSGWNDLTCNSRRHSPDRRPWLPSLSLRPVSSRAPASETCS
jgi:hypothetical protein